jgi:hypothetical protein
MAAAHTPGGYSRIMSDTKVPGYIDDKDAVARRLARIEGQLIAAVERFARTR